MKNIDNNPYDEMVKLIYKNDSNVDTYDIKIDSDNKKVTVKIEKNSSGIFSNVVGKERYKEESKYTGYLKNEKINRNIMWWRASTWNQHCNQFCHQSFSKARLQGHRPSRRLPKSVHI